MLAAAGRRLKINPGLCTESSTEPGNVPGLAESCSWLCWIQLNQEPSQPGSRAGKDNLHSKKAFSSTVFLMPSVKGGLFILVARSSEDEDMFGFAGSALPAFQVVPSKGFLS